MWNIYSTWFFFNYSLMLISLSKLFSMIWINLSEHCFITGKIFKYKKRIEINIEMNRLNRVRLLWVVRLWKMTFVLISAVSTYFSMKGKLQLHSHFRGVEMEVSSATIKSDLTQVFLLRILIILISPNYPYVFP